MIALPITNELHSPVRFRMDPAEQLQAFLQFESQGLDLLAIYHSHPNGPPHPSPTDIAEFTYPGVLYLILSPGPSGWQVREFEFRDGIFVPTQSRGEQWLNLMRVSQGRRPTDTLGQAFSQA